MAQSIYARYGLRPVINAAGTKSRLGGARLAPEVVEAMNAALHEAVDMAALQGAASQVIARVTGAEAGYVTTGAAAGLTLAAAAAMSGTDAARIDALPDTRSMANGLVILRTHRNSYDHAWRAAGARFVEVGVDDRASGAGVRGPEAWEIEAAIDDRTAAVAYVANRRNDPPLAVVCDVAHGKGVHVLVDAAAQLPPVDNLRRFIADGADLVAFSGGKVIGAPANTGFLCGRRDLIEAVALNHLDLDVDSSVYAFPGSLFPDGAPQRLPRHGIGRGFKLAKEQIIGLMVALERFVDGAVERAEGLRLDIAKSILAAAASTPQVRADLDPGYGVPRVVLRFEAPSVAEDVVRRLAEGEPPIEVDPSDLRVGLVTINTVNLDESDGAHVVRRLGEALRGLH